ncbi:MAG: hypothetical protein H7138_25915 [Myxococcales bacterium]|nr:hypothetical protein [Myxococcales bacterium]
MSDRPRSGRIGRGVAGALAVAAFAACSSKPSAKGRIVVAVTVDWEGAEITTEGLDAVEALRKQLGTAPLTHFVSAAYLTKDRPDPRATASLAEAVHPGDELAIHLHAWRSLARASGIDPKLSPSFVTGTDKLFEFEDGDIGFDTDLDVYSVVELRAMLRTSRRLLEQTQETVSKTFRAGGYLGTPKVLQAIREEGFVVDSSATDYRQIDEGKDTFMLKRVQEVWPKTETTSQPYFIDGTAKQLLEMPIAATADYVTAADIVITFEAAEARLQKAPTRDVFVVIGCNQETADSFAARLGEAIAKLGTKRPIADRLVFTTVEKAAALASPDAPSL